MRVLFILCATFFLLAQENIVYAQEIETSVAVDQTEIVVRNGVSGIWFPMDIAREVLSDVRELPLLRRQVTLIEEQLTLREQQLDRNYQQIEHERAAREEVMSQFESMQERVERAEKRERIWYRSPGLWFVIGCVCTVALVIAGAVILKSVQPNLIYDLS